MCTCGRGLGGVQTLAKAEWLALHQFPPLVVEPRYGMTRHLYTRRYCHTQYSLLLHNVQLPLSLLSRRSLNPLVFILELVLCSSPEGDVLVC